MRVKIQIMFLLHLIIVMRKRNIINIEIFI